MKNIKKRSKEPSIETLLTSATGSEETSCLHFFTPSQKEKLEKICNRYNRISDVPTLPVETNVKKSSTADSLTYQRSPISDPSSQEEANQSNTVKEGIGRQGKSGSDVVLGDIYRKKC